MPAYHFPALMELDLAVNRQLHKGKGGLSKELREMDLDSAEIPAHFELFEARSGLEKHLSRQELVAYDKVLAKYLKQDVLIPKLKRDIYRDYNM